MKILQITDVPDCFNTSLTKEILFDQPVTKDYIQYLGQHGQLDYYAEFPRPFYKLQKSGYYILQGVEGTDTARVILDRTRVQEALQNLTEMLIGFIVIDHSISC